MQRTDTLAVQPEILGEGLRDAEFERRPAEEVPDGPGVGGEAAGGETLAVGGQLGGDGMGREG